MKDPAVGALLIVGLVAAFVALGAFLVLVESLRAGLERKRDPKARHESLAVRRQGARTKTKQK